METIFINHRSGHHAKNSGYNRLIDFFEDSVCIPTENFRLSYKIKKKIVSFTNKNGGLYNSNSAQKDFELALQILKSKNKKRIVHYLNGEFDIGFGTSLKKIYNKTKFCSTFHYPPSILEKDFKNSIFFKKLDGLIAVSENQVDYLKNRLDLENVKFIPHGVETNFFKPKQDNKSENSLLFVGQHLRDFEALNYAIPRLKEKIPSIKINAVLRNDYSKNILPNSCITIHNQINDEELLKLYQEATLLFLPLIDATACNSILEALSAGLPVISTDIGGNKSYIKNNSGILTPKNDYTTLIDTTLSLLKNTEQLQRMGENARQTAFEFEWRNVATQMSEFHKNLINI
jgi:glycosyltransferase involved in cell wall biosynthesis